MQVNIKDYILEYILELMELNGVYKKLVLSQEIDQLDGEKPGGWLNSQFYGIFLFKLEIYLNDKYHPRKVECLFRARRFDTR
jgi:hypothetical protein